jgi:ATP-dependent helicase/nuclease subunit A
VSAPEQLRIGEAPPAVRPAANGDRPPTEEQAAAIANRDRDVFLVAGAGTGKTRVLVRRYCDAITDDGLGLDAILAFTFTEKAAGELRTRIRQELADRAAAEPDSERARELWRLARDTDRAWIGTIHGFCRRLLATHPVAAGLDPRFRVLAESEADLVAERAFDAALDEITTEDPEAEAMAAGYKVHRLRHMVVATYEQLRSQGAERPELPVMGDPAPASTGGDNGGDPGLTAAEAAAATEAYGCLRELLSAYGRHYERLKEERSALDFEDLQLRAVRLLRERTGIADVYRERFTHLMVDEFQDTNRLQLELIHQLRGPETRLFTVGDEFQSIYGFRNADLEVFRAERARAERTPDDQVAVLPLRGNFRSRPEVVAAINALGGVLLEGFEPLSAARTSAEPEAGQAVELLLTECDGWEDEGVDVARLTGEGTSAARVAEARFLASRLRGLADSGVPRKGMVVLLRAFTHVATYEEALERAGLGPYVVGGRGYWSDQQVEDMLRLLACVANPLEDESLFGALACPAVGVRPDALWLLRRAATEDDRPRHVWPVLERHFGVAEDGEGGPAPEPDPRIDAIEPQDGERLRDFCARLARLRAAAPLLSLEALCDRTAREFGYDLAVLMRNRGRQRLANVRKLMRLARQFELAEGRDLGGFLRYAEARKGREREGQAATEAEDHDGVRIMTIHAAKGLEFETVAVGDLARGLLGAGGWVDLRVGPSGDGDEGAPSLGLQLARAGRKSIKLWEFERLKDEASEADAAEELRLVYVAVTRARERLLLSGTFGDGDLEEGEAMSRSALKRLLPALGFTGGESELELDGARIAVRVNRAGAETARELVRRADGALVKAEIEPGDPPPLLAPSTDIPAAGHLSYAALADYERCGYRFYVKRVLGIREPESIGAEPGEADVDQLIGEADLGPGEPAPDAGERRLRFGTAVHGLLEWSARNRWARPGRERCGALLRQEGLDPADGEVARALELVDGWLESDLRASLEVPRVRLRPEMPFMLAVGASVVRGKMDLLAELPGGELLVVDYKTDALGDSSPESHAERYATQRTLYALAASSGVARDVAGPNGEDAQRIRTAYCFLEAPGQPYEQSFGPAELEAGRGEIERLVAGVRSGRFEVTDAPHLALCHDCPARERLCSHPMERTMARLDR